MHNSFENFGRVFFALCKSVDTPYSLSAWLRFKDRKAFLELPPIDAARYDTPFSFAKDYLIQCYASKMRDVKLDDRDLATEALIGFISDEERNRTTNERLSSLSSVPGGPDVERWIFIAQRKIAKVLGPFRLSNVLKCCFGNGATDALPRARARRDQKYVSRFTVTASASRWARIFTDTSPLWQDFTVLKPDVVPGNVFDTVPKSVKTDRTIAKEPLLNGYLQQGVHVYIRSRLLKFGIDLRDSSRNQYLASRAYCDGWSTLDLRSASNSVTRELVWLLLPIDWAAYLDDLRSSHTQLPDGSWHENQMFSSMGNAFTFELETLIFWALSSQFGEVAVYGDDIVCRRTSYDDTVRCLRFFGFEVNLEKSFKEGNFFESCGKHYFKGCDVTPAYQKDDPMRSLIDRVRAHNRLFRWTRRIYGVDNVGVAISAMESLKRVEKGVFGPPVRDGDPFFFTTNEGLYHAKDRQYHRYLVSLVPLLPRRSAVQSGAYLWWLDSKQFESSDKRLTESSDALETSFYQKDPKRDRVRYVERWMKYHPWRFDGT